MIIKSKARLKGEEQILILYSSPKEKMTSLQNTRSLSFLRYGTKTKQKGIRAHVLIFLISLQMENRPKEL